MKHLKLIDYGIFLFLLIFIGLAITGRSMSLSLSEMITEHRQINREIDQHYQTVQRTHEFSKTLLADDLPSITRVFILEQGLDFIEKEKQEMSFKVYTLALLNDQIKILVDQIQKLVALGMINIIVILGLVGCRFCY